jgi:outer membrane protein OmpA-like peptidoglycan-associated protein
VRFNTRLALAATAVALVTAPVAMAQDGRFELDQFVPASSQRTGYITMDSGQARLPNHIEVGTFLYYVGGNLVLYVDGEPEETVVDTQIIDHVYVSWSPIDRLRVSFDAPLYFTQTGANEDRLGLAAGDLDSGFGLGDLRLSLKLNLFDGRAPLDFSADERTAGAEWFTRRSGVALAVMGVFALPTGDPDLFQGEGFRAEPRLVFDYAHTSGFGVGVSLGYLIREDQRLLNLELGDVLRYAVAIRSQEYFDVLSLVGEIYGSATFGGEDVDIHSHPMEFVGTTRWNLGDILLGLGAGTGMVSGYGAPRLRIFASMAWSPEPEREPVVGDCDSDGIPDADDGCECEAEDYDSFEDWDGCPDPDNDSDRILDSVDQCRGVDDDSANAFVEVAEDYDSFEDNDGCPEVDNDRDGIIDHPQANDRCPGTDAELEAGMPSCTDRERGTEDWYICSLQIVRENYNGIEDADGCPDTEPFIPPPLIEIGPVYFNYDVGDEIQDRSRPMLETMARVLQDHPEFTRIQVQAHTDERGGDDYNQRLSDQRAATVRRELIRLGVDASRLEAIGLGESRLFFRQATTEAQHQANRRVEFWIMEINGEPVSSAPDTVIRLEPEALPPDPE